MNAKIKCRSQYYIAADIDDNRRQKKLRRIGCQLRKRGLGGSGWEWAVRGEAGWGGGKGWIGMGCGG